MIDQVKYGRLTMVGMLDERTADGHILASWSCECGGNVKTAHSRVKRGYTKSCGCINKEGKLQKTHGMKYTKTYSSWSSAKDRATNVRSKDYYRYGGAGIGMSADWMVFENFLADMGIRPDGKTLDRIDPNKGYEPGNCRWATPLEQSRNRKDLVIIHTPYGEMPLVDYAEKIGLSNGAAHLRMKREKLEGCYRV